MNRFRGALRRLKEETEAPPGAEARVRQRIEARIEEARRDYQALSEIAPAPGAETRVRRRLERSLERPARGARLLAPALVTAAIAIAVVALFLFRAHEPEVAPLAQQTPSLEPAPPAPPRSPEPRRIVLGAARTTGPLPASAAASALRGVERQLVRCHRTTQTDETAGRRLELVLVAGAGGAINSWGVQPNDARARAFVACARSYLSSVEAAGELRAGEPTGSFSTVRFSIGEQR